MQRYLMINLEISYQVKMPLFWGGFLNKLAQITASHLRIQSNLALSVVFVSPPIIKKYNRIYRHQPSVTDVLSFNEVNEILICYAKAKNQAKNNHTTIKMEIGWLFIHGLLHLLGYTHETEKKYKKMVELQKTIMQKAVK